MSNDLATLVSETQIALDAAKTVSDSLWNDYFSSDEPNMLKIRTEYHTMMIFEYTVGQYLYKAQQMLEEIDALMKQEALA